MAEIHLLLYCLVAVTISGSAGANTERTANSSVSHCQDVPTVNPLQSSPFLLVYPPSLESSPEQTEAIIPLYIGLMTSLSGEDQGMSVVVPAVQIALDAINDHPNLLDDYSLHYTLTQSECLQREVLDSVFTQLFQPPGKGSRLSLIGSVCPETSQLSERITHHYNVTQITCVPTNQNRDETNIHTVFHVFPSDREIVLALVSVVSTYEWSQVALMVEDDYYNRYASASKLLKELLEPENVTYSEITLQSTNGSLDLEDNIFTTDANSRIFILAMSSKLARQLICKAYHLGIRYPRYLFLTFGSYESKWWIPPLDEDVYHQCTPEQRAEVLQYSLAVLQLQDSIEDSDIDGYSGIVVGDFFEDYTQRVGCLESNDTSTAEFAQYCYDATWVLALALNRTVTDLRNNGTLFELVKSLANTARIEDFTYNNHILAERISHNLHQTDFLGRTGRVRFNQNGSRTTGGVRLQQYRACDHSQSSVNHTHKTCNLTGSLELVEFGSSADGQFQYLYGESNDTVWPGFVPYDGRTKHETVTVSVPLTVVYDLLATIGIVFTIICLVFNFVFRKTKIVQLTSPNLNYLIIAGVFLIYANVFVNFVPSKNPVAFVTTCIVQIWLLAIGYSLSLGTIVAKLWRIYYIFRYPDTSRKHTISDRHLMIFVFLLVSVNVLILIVYVVVEATVSHFQTELEPNKETMSELVGEQDVYVVFHNYPCSSVPIIRTLAIAIIYIIIFGLQLFAVFLAFKTRKVKIKGLNDAKYIAAIVYIVSIQSIGNVAISFTLRGYVNAFPAAFNMLTLVVATLVLALVFLPKMISLYRDPEGNHIFSYAEEDIVRLSTIFVNESHCRSCKQLRKKIVELENVRHTSKNDFASLFDNPSLRHSCPVLVSDGKNFSCRSLARIADSQSSVDRESMSSGVNVGTSNDSLEGFGDSLQLGERV